MPRKIASVKNANPSSANGSPIDFAERPMNRGHSRPSSNDSTVPDTAPTANRMPVPLASRFDSCRYSAIARAPVAQVGQHHQRGQRDAAAANTMWNASEIPICARANVKPVTASTTEILLRTIAGCYARLVVDALLAGTGRARRRVAGVPEGAAAPAHGKLGRQHHAARRRRALVRGPRLRLHRGHGSQLRDRRRLDARDARHSRRGAHAERRPLRAAAAVRDAVPAARQRAVRDTAARREDRVGRRRGTCRACSFTGARWRPRARWEASRSSITPTFTTPPTPR